MQPVPAEVTGLAVDLVLHVAGREDAFNAGLGGVAVAPAAGDEVAVVHFQLAGEDVGVRLVADGDENAMPLASRGRAGFMCLSAGR
jgi:hypothetical protein